MKYKLLEDIKSNRMIDKKQFKIYGYKGEIVEIIAEHGNVFIVQGLKEKFSVKIEQIQKI